MNSWSYLFGQKIIEYLCLSGQSTVLGTGNTEVNDSKPWVNERGLLLCLEKNKNKNVNMSRFHGQRDAFMERLSLKTWLKVQEDMSNK